MLGIKKLYIFSFKSFIGPFLATFAISMFILIMQFTWKYIDDLMGKGIETWIIVQLMFYVSASLIPLALPLAMLLSSIMTMGNLAENNELTALKSSGMSLFKILRPLTVIVLFIALGTFYFANYIIPVANLKWHSIIFDIQNTKIATIITPGVYSNALDGYAIKADKELSEGEFEGIIIHDKTNPNELKTIIAEKATMYKSNNGKYLFFDLKNGSANEELAVQPPTFSPDGKLHPSESSNRPARRTQFDQATYKISLDGFALAKSEDELFKNKHEMLNVFQIRDEVDSVFENVRETQLNFAKNVKMSHEYFQAKNFVPVKESMAKDTLRSEAGNRELENIVSDTLYSLNKLKKEQKSRAAQVAIGKIDNRIRNLESQMNYLETQDVDLRNYWVEFHRKFALTYAILILFFVGAPLGAIVRKGGFGAPVVIAALLFMTYFIMITVGENLVQSKVLRPSTGMWFASYLLTPIAMWLMWSASTDRPLLSIAEWRKRRKRLSK